MAVKCVAGWWIDWATGILHTESCWFGQRLIQIGECRDGCCMHYECPDCGHTFWVEFPD